MTKGLTEFPKYKICMYVKNMTCFFHESVNNDK